MTQMTYDVLNRPKKGSTGRTNVGWGAECGRDAVTLGGYLITSRTGKGEPRQYTAMVLISKPETGQDIVVETMVGTSFETRATAAFAIWRKYYEGWRTERTDQKAQTEQVLQQKRDARARNRLARQTPEGKEAYRLDLNAKARARRAVMTDEEKAADAAKLREKREGEAFAKMYSTPT